MRVVLIRHLMPLVEAGTCYGRLNVAMHPSAAEHVATIVSNPALFDVRMVWTSPAMRCRDLAEAIAKARAVPLHIDHRLLELDFGAWEGKRWDDVERTELDRWAATPLTFAPPGGESGADLIARISDFHAGARRGGHDCAIVSHGGPLKVLRALLLGEPVNLLASPPGLGSIAEINCRVAA